MTDEQLSLLAESFCAAPLPESVCADVCATKQGLGRLGTNLLTVAEAKVVLGHALAATTARPTERGAVEGLKQPSAEATALALTATPDTFPTDSYSLALWLDRALTPPVTVAATDQAGEERAAWFKRNADRSRSGAFINTDPAYFASECADAITAGTLAALDTQPATGRTMGGENGLRKAIAAAGTALQNGGE